MPEYRIVHTKNNDYSNNLLLGSFPFFISLNIPKMFQWYKKYHSC